MGWQDAAQDWVLSPGTIQSLGTLVGTVAGGVAGGPVGAAIGTTAGSAVGGLAEGITKAAVGGPKVGDTAPGTEQAQASQVPAGVVPEKPEVFPAYGESAPTQLLAVQRDADGVDWLQLPEQVGVREVRLVSMHLAYRKGGKWRRLVYKGDGS